MSRVCNAERPNSPNRDCSPHSGMLSLLVVLNDGRAIEVAMVGREGIVGAMAGLGLYKSSVR